MADADAAAIAALPLSQRVAHRSWKTRIAAYDEVAAVCADAATLDTAACTAALQPWTSSLRPAAVDANAAAQEAGLAMVLAFVAAAPTSLASAAAPTLVPALVDKGLAASRPAARRRAADIVLMLVEADVDAAAIVSDLVAAGLAHKVPRTVAASLAMLRDVLNDFGPQVISIKLLLACLPKAFEHRDQSVRAEGQLLAIAIYKWIGPSISQFLNDLKPIQQKELAETFTNTPRTPMTPTRLTRAAQKAAAAASAAGGGDPTAANATNSNGTSAIASCAVDVDPYDLVDPTPVLKNLPHEFYKNVASTQWKERKDALEALLALVKAPKLEDDKYHELISALSKRVADVNIVCAILAINCLEYLAKGLRSAFAQYRAMFMHQSLERLKEKKQNLVDALRNELDAVFASVASVETILDDFSFGIKNKNPQVRSETLGWMFRSLKANKPGLDGKKLVIKQIAEGSLASFNDSDSSVRDAASEVLGVLLKLLGERQLSPYLSRLDKIKEKKVRDFATNLVIAQPPPAIPKPVAQSAPLQSKSSMHASKPSQPVSKPELSGNAPSSFGTTGVNTEMDQVSKPNHFSTAPTSSIRVPDVESEQKIDTLEKVAAKPTVFEIPVFEAPRRPMPARFKQNSARGSTNDISVGNKANNKPVSPISKPIVANAEKDDDKSVTNENLPLVNDKSTTNLSRKNSTVEDVEITFALSKSTTTTTIDAATSLAAPAAENVKSSSTSKTVDTALDVKKDVSNATAQTNGANDQVVFSSTITAPSETSNHSIESKYVKPSSATIVYNNSMNITGSKRGVSFHSPIKSGDSRLPTSTSPSYTTSTQLGSVQRNSINRSSYAGSPAAKMARRTYMNATDNQQNGTSQDDTIGRLFQGQILSDIPMDASSIPSETMKEILDKIMGENILGGIDALKKLEDYLMKTPECLVPFVNSIVKTLTLQFNVVCCVIVETTNECGAESIKSQRRQIMDYQKKHPDADFNKVEELKSVDVRLIVELTHIGRMMRHVLTAFVHLYTSPVTATAVSVECLRPCLLELLERLVDPVLFMAMPDNAEVSGALNMLIVRIINHVERRTSFDILLAELQKSTTRSLEMVNKSPQQIQQSKYTELIMKCLWKLTQSIGA